MNIARAKEIQGWMTEGELLFLAEQASKTKIILEVGSYCGRSTRAMADNIMAGGTIYAIDPWDGKYEGYDSPRDLAQRSYAEGDPIEKKFFENLADHIENGRVVPIKQSFHNVTDFNIVPNMIFIDANHEYSRVKRDILYAISLMPLGGFLCGHDYTGSWHQVIEAVDDIFGKGIRTHESIWYTTL